MEKSKALQTSKAKRIQHHQTSFATNANGTSLGGKQKATMRNNKIMNGKAHQERQTYCKNRKSSTHKYDIKTSKLEKIVQM